MRYATLKSNSENFKALTSLDPDEFEKLLSSFSKVWQDYLDQRDPQALAEILAESDTLDFMIDGKVEPWIVIQPGGASR